MQPNPVTVLFGDQVGSTALLTRLGHGTAEDIRRDLFEPAARRRAMSR